MREARGDREYDKFVADINGNTAVRVKVEGLDLSGYCPYTGATSDVNLGIYSLDASDIHANQVLSSEYIANSDFATDTLFTTENGTITWSAGSYTFNGSAIKSQAFSDMLIAPSAGTKRYKYQFYVSAYSGSTPVFYPLYPNNPAITITATGLYTGEADVEITDPYKFGGGGSGNSQITIDYISIKEVTKGNVYADRYMYADKFVTQGGTSSQFVKGDGTLDSSTYISDLSTFTTDNLTQGSTNIYFNNGTLDTITDGSSYTKQMIADGATAYSWGDWSGQGFITSGDVPTYETDPIFNAWLIATPPLYSETDPLSLHLDQSTQQTVIGKPMFQDGITIDDTGVYDFASGTFGVPVTNGFHTTTTSGDGGYNLMVVNQINSPYEGAGTTGALGFLNFVDGGGSYYGPAVAYGVFGFNSLYNTGYASALVGGEFQSNISQGSYTDGAVGVKGVVGVFGGATADNAYGSAVDIISTGASSLINTAYGYKVDIAAANSGAIGTIYGLYITDVNTATTGNYAIYTNDGLVWFGDDVRTTARTIAGPDTTAFNAFAAQYTAYSGVFEYMAINGNYVMVDPADPYNYKLDYYDAGVVNTLIGNDFDVDYYRDWKIDAKEIKINTNGGSGTITFGTTIKTDGGRIGKITTATNTYQVLVSDETIICNKTTAFTVTLPTAVVGQIFDIKNIGVGVVTVDGAGTDLIDDVLTVALSQWEGVTLQCYVANKWVII